MRGRWIGRIERQRGATWRHAFIFVTTFKSLWVCKCICVQTFAYVRVHAFASECVKTHLPSYMWMCKQISMPTLLIWNLFCLSRAINQWCKKIPIDLFYRIWSIRFLRYWLIDKSTELLKLKKQSSNWDLKLEQNTVEHDVVHFGTILCRVNIHAS